MPLFYPQTHLDDILRTYFNFKVNRVKLGKLIAFIRCRAPEHKVASDKSVLERVMYDSVYAKRAFI